MPTRFGATEEITTNGDIVAISQGSGAFASQVTFQISGSWTGTLTFQASVNQSDYTTMQATNLNSGSAVTTTTGNGLFRVDASGLIEVRVKATASITGTAEVTPTWVIG